MKKIFSALCCFLVACSNSVGVSSEKTETAFMEDSLLGMVRVNTKEITVVLGSNEISAKVNERPSMVVKLDYAYSIGKHEVTCSEFNALMQPLSGLLLTCEGDQIPATNLTYYDAVLYANERSKTEGFDTAYTYVKATFDAEKHCTNLEGFAFLPEVDAFRLPTESEWVLAADSQWNVSWTAENSESRLHDVCSLADSTVMVCDMAGNAMEWVNDWLGSFRDTMLTNYVGAPDGGSLGQRVVKGGCYRHSASAINRYSRGDVYAVTSSTRAEYVGFRLAFGSIPKALWMNSDGKVASKRIIPLATSTTIRSVTGTYKVKLSFRNELTKNLAFIDYSNGLLSVTEIEDSLDVYHPEISPDGKKVAFCTGLEGVSGKSSLYVRDLNAEGTNLVKLDVESAAIPRWMVLPNGDTVIVYVTDVGNNKNESEFKSASTWQVTFANGKFGTPQKLFDGAYHGGISEDNTLAVTGARLLRARIAKPNSTVQQDALDTVWYKNNGKGEQACNVSLARDSSKRTLFLDFGGATGRAFVGKNYGTHERLLVADASGKLKQSVASPLGWTFDHSEWTLGGKNLAVATLANANGAHTKIVLVNLTDSSVVDLAEGDELWHPCLWVKNNIAIGEDVLLDLDSAGMYTVEDGSARSKILRYRMELMWKYRDSAELVALGSSRTSNGVDVSLLKVLGVNLSYFPSNFYDVVQYYERYIEKTFKKLKYIVVSVDIDFWNSPKETSFFFSEYESFPGYVYDRNHHYWKDEDCRIIYAATENAPGDEIYEKMFLNMHSSVFLPPVGWGEIELYDSTWMDQYRLVYEDTYRTFVEFLKETGKNGHVVIGVLFPQAPEYRNTGSLGRHGLRRSEAVEIIDSLNNLQKKFDNFIFIDENKMGNHDYTDLMAQDCDHLNDKGAEQLTRRLDSLIGRLN